MCVTSQYRDNLGRKRRNFGSLGCYQLRNWPKLNQTVPIQPIKWSGSDLPGFRVKLEKFWSAKEKLMVATAFFGLKLPKIDKRSHQQCYGVFLR